MFLFDTDILSNIVKKIPSPILLAKLKKVPKDLQFTSSINIAEIYYGASRSSKRDAIIRIFEEKVFPHISILPFDEGSARIYGELKAKLEKYGVIKSEPDLRIAAIVLQHRLILITGNIKHFKNIPGLKSENWLGKDST